MMMGGSDLAAAAFMTFTTTDAGCGVVGRR